MKKLLISAMSLAALFMVVGCKTAPKDYTTFRQHRPKSILVLPPVNESVEPKATYGYLATVTYPLAEQGYYVYPVAVIDQLMKENGMPTPGEMHQAPLNKIDEVVGADAVLYITLNEYGSKYQVINSSTIVSATASLVDVKTGKMLWNGDVTSASNSSAGSSDIASALVAAVITQIINSSTDAAHNQAKMANAKLFTTPEQGLLYGPYHPKFGTEAMQ